MRIAHNVLLSLGATQVFDIDDIGDDPQTEDEFLSIRIESPIEITWQMYQERYPIVEQKFGLRILRRYRDEILRSTDWIMTMDVYPTLANKDEWIAYRQSLRELPSNPPPFKWKGWDLDISQMNIPIKPSIIRIDSSSEKVTQE